MFDTSATRWVFGAILVVTLPLLPTPLVGQASVVFELPDAPIASGPPVHPLVEPRPALHPVDPAVQVVTAILRGAEGAPWHCLALVSRDAGASWVRHDFDGMERCIDPWALVLEDGTILVSAIDIRSDAEGDERFELLVWRSTDRGSSWEGPVRMGRTHEHTIFEAGSDGAVLRLGRVTSPTPEGAPRHAVQLARSTDGGSTFREILRLVPGRRSVMPTGLVPLDDGRLAVSYRGSNRDMATGQELDAPATTAHLLLVSADGREVEQSVIDEGCSTGALESAFPGYPALAGTPSGSLHHACVRPGLDGISYSRSEDSGRSWSTPRRIDGFAGTGRTHVRTPMVAVTAEGTVGIAWYDRRHDPGRSCQDVYFTARTSEGDFIDPVRVTTETSCPGAEGNGVAGRSWPMGGDYGSLVAGPDGRFHLVWADSRSGHFQLRRAVIRVAG